MAGLLAGLLVLPARAAGHEAAQAFRRLVDMIVSKSDFLFELVTKSETAADNVRSVQAWGAWIIYGLVAALLAVLITRWLTKKPMSWLSIAIVLVIWIAIYLLVWNWDSELRFNLHQFRLGELGTQWGAWPHASPYGYFGGFAVALILTAMPWRKRITDVEPPA